MNRKQIIIWGAWYGSKNVGDQALLLAITDMLSDIIEDVEFIVLTTNPVWVSEYTTRDSVNSFCPLHSRKQFIEVVKSFFIADAFIFGGGVPFYDEMAHSLAIVLLVTLARIFKVPYALWAVSSLFIHSNVSKSILRYVLSNASVVTYRDSHTRKLFNECGRENDQQQLVPDPVFTLHLNDDRSAQSLLMRAGRQSSRPLVALTPRPLRGRDGESHTHYAPKSDFDSQKEVEVFSAVLDWLWENGYQPIFVPMNTVAPDDDREVAHKIMAIAYHGNQALLIDEEIFPRDAANVYKECHAAFVARVHGFVTAFLGRCPILMYAFDWKHKGIMEQTGFSKYIFDPEKHVASDAVGMMSQILESRSGLIAQMEKKHEELLNQARIPRDAVIRLLKPE